MSSAVETIKAAIERIQQTPKLILLGTVAHVSEFTCDVEFDDHPTRYDVRLTAVNDKLDNYTVVYPKPGSKVLVGIIESMETDAVLLNCSEIDSVVTKIGEAQWVIDKNGCLLQKGNENLQQVLSDFIVEVQKIIVVQGTSPNVPALTDINNRLKKILK